MFMYAVPLAGRFTPPPRTQDDVAHTGYAPLAAPPPYKRRKWTHDKKPLEGAERVRVFQRLLKKVLYLGECSESSFA